MAITTTLVDSSNTTVYTSPGNSAITALYLVNSGAGAGLRSVNLYVVPSGDSPTLTNLIYQSLSIPVGDTYLIDSERLVLDTGDTIVAQADAADEVSCIVSSMDI